MTVAELNEQIEALLTDGPLTTKAIYKTMAATTDASAYDVVAALNSLFRAGRVTHSDTDVPQMEWRLESVKESK